MPVATVTDINVTEMRAAIEVAQVSPDPSTQNGAVLIPVHQGSIISDCNRFPSRVEYKEERWERPLKYSIIEHAERNVIYKAANFGIRTDGATMVCPWAACADCARAIIQAGLSRLIRLGSMDNTHERWDESVRIGDEMMMEAGIEILNLIVPEPFGIVLRRNGEELTF